MIFGNNRNDMEHGFMAVGGTNEVLVKNEEVLLLEGKKIIITISNTTAINLKTV